MTPPRDVGDAPVAGVFGDPDGLRRLAARLEGLAARLDDVAARTEGAARSLRAGPGGWTGAAADALDRVQGMRRAELRDTSAVAIRVASALRPLVAGLEEAGRLAEQAEMLSVQAGSGPRPMVTGRGTVVERMPDDAARAVIADLVRRAVGIAEETWLTARAVLASIDLRLRGKGAGSEAEGMRWRHADRTVGTADALRALATSPSGVAARRREALAEAARYRRLIEDYRHASWLTQGQRSRARRLLRQAGGVERAAGAAYDDAARLAARVPAGRLVRAAGSTAGDHLPKLAGAGPLRSVPVAGAGLSLLTIGAEITDGDDPVLTLVANGGSLLASTMAFEALCAASGPAGWVVGGAFVASIGAGWLTQELVKHPGALPEHLARSGGRAARAAGLAGRKVWHGLVG